MKVPGVNKGKRLGAIEYLKETWDYIWSLKTEAQRGLTGIAKAIHPLWVKVTSQSIP